MNRRNQLLCAWSGPLILIGFGVGIPLADPQVTQALHDLGWMFFILYFSPVLVQTLAIGIAIVGGGGQTVFPRWVGYLNFWVALGLLPAALVPFFKSGPFAWHGIFAFWLTVLVVFSWIVVMTTTTVRAINQEAVPAGGHPAVPYGSEVSR